MNDKDKLSQFWDKPLTADLRAPLIECVVHIMQMLNFRFGVKRDGYKKRYYYQVGNIRYVVPYGEWLRLKEIQETYIG